jgi:hypothetical protein
MTIAIILLLAGCIAGDDSPSSGDESTPDAWSTPDIAADEGSRAAPNAPARRPNDTGAAPSATPPAAESVDGHLEPEAVFDGDGDVWATVERFHDPSIVSADAYPPDGRGDHVDPQRTYFGGAQPSAATFLLYSSVGLRGGDLRPPVLLVHGANDTVERGWTDPGSLGGFGCGRLVCPREGLATALVNDDRRVFAVGFAHRQGDNFPWAAAIENVIEIIRRRTGEADVDVIGWSKGAFAARLLAAGVAGSGVRAPIRKLILIGNPNAGFDYLFRHGIAHDATVFPECGGTINAPAPHVTTTCFGSFVRHPDLDVYGTSGIDPWRGQRQMVAQLDAMAPVASIDVDWYTTYYGGTGFLSVGSGVERAVRDDSLIEQMRTSPVPETVEAFLLCGAAPTIPGIHNEHTAPSDGVLFVESCLDETGIDRVAGSRLFPTLNHLELGYAGPAVEQIRAWLDA